MYGQSSDSNQSVKRLGELLLESGFVAGPDLERAVELSRKNFQSLGKVLVGWKICRQEEINNALEIQRICKLEGMTGTVAVRVLSLMKAHMYTVQEALLHVGWTHPNYNPFMEPEEIIGAKRALKDLGVFEGVAYAVALEKIGDAYAAHDLGARAEGKYAEAQAVLEKGMPRTMSELTSLLTKQAQLAVAQKRHDEAREILKRAQDLVDQTGNKASKEYAKVMHVSAEYHVSRRKFSEAEKHYVECFRNLAPVCGLQDEQVLDTIRQYVAIMGKSGWNAEDKVTLGELFKGAGLVNEEELTAGWQLSRKNKVALGRALVDSGFVKERDLQLVLQTQLLVREGEITSQLAIWIVIYAVELNKSLDGVLALFNCEPKSRSALSSELKDATKQMSELESRLPPTHTELAFAHAKVAGIYFQRQQWQEAEHHYKRALEIVSVNPNLNLEKVIEIVDNYFELKAAENDLDEMVKLGKISVQLRSKHHGPASIPFAKGVERLANVFCLKGDHSTALSCLDRAMTVRERLYGDEDRQLIVCLEAKADCLIHLLEFIEAENILDRALKIADEAYGRPHLTTDSVLAKLVNVLKEMGKTEKINEIAPGALKDELVI